VRVASGLALVSPRQPRQSHPDRGVRPSTGLDKALTGLTDKASTYSDTEPRRSASTGTAPPGDTDHTAPARSPLPGRCGASRPRRGLLRQETTSPVPWDPGAAPAGAVRRASTLTVTLVPHSSADTPFRRHSDAIPHHRRRRRCNLHTAIDPIANDLELLWRRELRRSAVGGERGQHADGQLVCTHA